MDKELIFSYRQSTARTEPSDAKHPRLLLSPSGGGGGCACDPIW